jgi:hypothetical protein
MGGQKKRHLQVEGFALVRKQQESPAIELSIDEPQPGAQSYLSRSYLKIVSDQSSDLGRQDAPGSSCIEDSQDRPYKGLGLDLDNDPR